MICILCYCHHHFLVNHAVDDSSTKTIPNHSAELLYGKFGRMIRNKNQKSSKESSIGSSMKILCIEDFQELSHIGNIYVSVFIDISQLFIKWTRILSHNEVYECTNVGHG